MEYKTWKDIFGSPTQQLSGLILQFIIANFYLHFADDTAHYNTAKTISWASTDPFNEYTSLIFDPLCA